MDSKRVLPIPSSYRSNKRVKAEKSEVVSHHFKHEECWPRPTAPLVDTRKDFLFQQFDIDYVTGDVLPGMMGSKDSPVAILRMYGITDDGCSVFARVHGFTPYFYMDMPSDSNCESFRRKLNEQMRGQVKGINMQDKKDYIPFVERVNKQSLMGYSHGPSPKFKVFTSLPAHVSTARNCVERMGLRTYESNLPFVLRFMIDFEIVGCSWIRITGGKYRINRSRSSHCQIELDVSADGIVALNTDGEGGKIAPFRIFSFDIECANRAHTFPEAKHDPVIQIANMVTLNGEQEPIVKNLFCLGTCSHIAGSDVYEFENEREMLMAFHDFLIASDPDMIIGFNIINFDIPYLLERAATLKLPEFPYWGRIRRTPIRMKDGTFSSRAYGTRDSKEITIDGRIPFDIMQAIQRDHKLRSYSLNFVSATFLGEQKEEVHHSQISVLFEGSADDRRRLGVYCLKDAYLPQRLLDKLMLAVNYVEMARVTGIPLSYILPRGQQIKVISQLYRKANKENMIIPAKVSRDNFPEGGGIGYAGATVIEPKRGFHDYPVATLDFTSLYPSIMIAHNLCYTTITNKDTMDNFGFVKGVDYEVTPSNDVFVRPNRRAGILPRILEDLLAARRRAKQELAKETNPFKRAVLDGRQLALKISANSVYGFTGATVGRMPCLEIASSVTAYGREMIDLTKSVVESTYTIENGYAHNAVVVYGDTDSVMINFGADTVRAAMDLGRKAAVEVTKQFLSPINLEFEKVYYPYLLISKKRYAGLLWMQPDKYMKMDTKGIETVRRDNCTLVKHVIETCLHKILIDRDPESAQVFVKKIIGDLLQNKMDLSLLVISKALSKRGSDYAGKQAHVELANKMRARDPLTAPNIGDRVPYVIVKANKGAKAYEKAEDPLWVLDKNIPLDYQYYIEQQLQNPLMRIFKPIMNHPQQLLSGSHTRNVIVPTPTLNTKGSIMSFMKKSKSCVGCRTAIYSDSVKDNLCPSCISKRPELIYKHVGEVSALEQRFNRCWTQCQNCQASLHQSILCTNRDCPIFYMRKKVQTDLCKAQKTLETLEVNDW